MYPIQFLLLASLISSSYAFTIKKPNLRTIVFNRALYSSFIEKFSFDSADETILTQISIGFDGHTFHPIYFVTAFTLGCLFKPDDTKLSQTQTYQTNRKASKNFLLFIFMVFARNVETAT